METQVHPFKKYTDRYGRTILEKKIVVYFRDGEILLKGFAKKQVGKAEDNKSEFNALEIEEVPGGWHKRKEYDFFYTPNTQNIISIINAKKYNNAIGFSDSFCIFLDRKIKEAEELDAGINEVKDLTLDDEEKIKNLPDLYVKRVPDFLHQKIASRFAYYLPQCGLLEEQGLGKTKTAIETFIAKKDKGLVDRCLVLGPLSVINRNGWGKQIKQYAPEGTSQVFLRGAREDKISIINGDHSEFDFYLGNYEGILNILDELLSWVDDRTMIILDESSKIKNFHAIRTRACIELGKLTKYKMILTGTPITNNAHEIFSQFYFLDGGDTFGSSYEKFLLNYFKKEGFKYFASKRMLESIHTQIFNKSVRFTKEVLKDLPDKIYQIREVQMTPVQKKYYETILIQEMIRLESLESVTAQNVLVTILRLQQITSGFLAPQDLDGNKLMNKPIEGPNPKLNELMDIMDELGESQVIVWTRFRFDIENIARELKKKGISYITYVGGMNELQREEAEKSFTDKRVRVFLSIPSAGGYGMNLQCANYEVYYSNDYSLQNRLQSEDRAHRSGQTKNVTIIDLVCKDTIDYKVLDVLLEKKEVADIVTGDTWKDFLVVKDEEDC